MFAGQKLGYYVGMITTKLGHKFLNNMKQTAVEWLEIELEKLWVQKYLSPITVKPLIEQAKEMENG
jgi:hypothetical protein